jgi:hypothetical protein
MPVYLTDTNCDQDRWKLYNTESTREKQGYSAASEIQVECPTRSTVFDQEVCFDIAVSSLIGDGLLISGGFTGKELKIWKSDNISFVLDVILRVGLASTRHCGAVGEKIAIKGAYETELIGPFSCLSRQSTARGGCAICLHPERSGHRIVS